MKPAIASASARIQLPALTLALALLFLCGHPTNANAQSVVTPMSTPTPVVEKQATKAGGTPQGTSALTATSTGFRMGPFILRPHASYRYLYGDGLRSAGGESKKTAIQSFSAGSYAELGAHLDFDYAATWSIYSSRGFRDTVDHAASGNWSTQYEDWSFSAGHSYSQTDSPMIETGRQTKQITHTTSFDALYALGSRYSLDTSLGQTLRFAEGFNDPMSWTIREMLHQKTTQNLDTAIGLEYGYTAIEKTADVSSIQLLTSLTWRPIKQLNMSLRGGLEKRHIYSQPPTDTSSPVYTGSIQYIPTNTTQIGVSISRSTSASFLDNQLSETTQYGFSFNQRLLKRFQFATSYSHADAKYSSTQPGFIVNRKDKTDSANFSLSTAFRTRIRTAVSYQLTNNSSNVSAFKLTSNQISFEISYSF